MKQGMREEIDELLKHEPFDPFVFVMNSGNRYEIRFADLMSLGESLIHVMRPRSNRRDVLRLTEISSIEVLDPD